MTINRRIFQGFFFIFSGRVGAGLLTVLITPILVRVLGSGGYGDYAFALAVYNILRTISGGGVYEGVRKYIAEDSSTERRASIFNYYLNVAILFGGTISILLVGVTYLTVGSVVLEPRLREYLFLVAALIFVRPFFYLVRSTLMGFELEKYSEPLIVLDKFFFGVIGLSLAYVGFHVTGALFGHVAALTFVTLIGYVAITRYTTIRFPGVKKALRKPTSLYETPMFTYSVLTILFVTITKSLYTTDILLLQPFAGSTRVGYYRASLVIAEFIWFVPLTIQHVLLHSSSKLWAEGRTRELNTISSNITRYTFLLTGFIAICLVTVGEPLLSMYFGTEFSASYIPLVILLPGVISFAIARPIYAIGQGHGNIKILIYATGSAAILNLILNIVLIPPYGMYGAAVATSIGYGSMLVFHIWSAKHIGFDPLQNVRPVRMIGTCLSPLPVVVYLDRAIHSDVISLAVVPFVGAIVFVLAAWGSGAISREELHKIRKATL